LPHVVSIQVGMPLWYDVPPGDRAAGKRWNTAFFKQPVAGPVQLHEDHLEGDGSSDRKNHGGTDKAVLAYSLDHYTYWRPLLAPDMPFGSFGENLSIEGQTEEDVCIGDVWQLGEIELEVTQPRQPCFKLARRWERPQLPREVIREGRTGWYYRVRKMGFVAAGVELTLRSRPRPDWPIARANQAYYARPIDSGQRLELAAVPELSFSWKEELLATS
jgi:MOSC domain-containing protein YiiM